ncbi:MAG: HAD superfamily hydrolase (TIGR01509 family) [Parasphingorhabdus sp.]
MTTLPLNWDDIDTVLLDMDGTLLDLKFDNDFWLQIVPVAYADKHSVSVHEACNIIFPRMRSLRGTINWYCVEFWSLELQLDIVDLKCQCRDAISLRDGSIAFLNAVKRSNRRQIMVTNAHEATLDIKMQRTGIAHLFNELISSHRFKTPKEQREFWVKLVEQTGVDLTRCLFIDDSAAVLDAAQDAGVGHILGVLKPDSSRPENHYENFVALDSYTEILPQ